MKVYLIGRFAERGALRAVRDDILRPNGVTVNSRWLDMNEPDERLSREDAGRISQICLDDIAACDLCLYYASPIPSFGRHADVGIALAFWKPIIVLGDTVTPSERNIHLSHKLCYWCPCGGQGEQIVGFVALVARLHSVRWVRP